MKGADVMWKVELLSVRLGRPRRLGSLAPFVSGGSSCCP